jgi:hypothetical protein
MNGSKYTKKVTQANKDFDLKEITDHFRSKESIFNKCSKMPYIFDPDSFNLFKDGFYW